MQNGAVELLAHDGSAVANLDLSLRGRSATVLAKSRPDLDEAVAAGSLVPMRATFTVDTGVQSLDPGSDATRAALAGDVALIWRRQDELEAGQTEQPASFAWRFDGVASETIDHRLVENTGLSDDPSLVAPGPNAEFTEGEILAVEFSAAAFNGSGDAEPFAFAEVRISDVDGNLLESHIVAQADARVQLRAPAVFEASLFRVAVRAYYGDELHHGDSETVQIRVYPGSGLPDPVIVGAPAELLAGATADLWIEGGEGLLASLTVRNFDDRDEVVVIGDRHVELTAPHDLHRLEVVAIFADGKGGQRSVTREIRVAHDLAVEFEAAAIPRFDQATVDIDRVWLSRGSELGYYENGSFQSVRDLGRHIIGLGMHHEHVVAVLDDGRVLTMAATDPQRTVADVTLTNGNQIPGISVGDIFMSAEVVGNILAVETLSSGSGTTYLRMFQMTGLTAGQIDLASQASGEIDAHLMVTPHRAFILNANGVENFLRGGLVNTNSALRLTSYVGDHVVALGPELLSVALANGPWTDFAMPGVVPARVFNYGHDLLIVDELGDLHVWDLRAPMQPRSRGRFQLPAVGSLPATFADGRLFYAEGEAMALRVRAESGTATTEFETTNFVGEVVDAAASGGGFMVARGDYGASYVELDEAGNWVERDVLTPFSATVSHAASNSAFPMYYTVGDSQLRLWDPLDAEFEIPCDIAAMPGLLDFDARATWMAAAAPDRVYIKDWGYANSQGDFFVWQACRDDGSNYPLASGVEVTAMAVLADSVLVATSTGELRELSWDALPIDAYSELGDHSWATGLPLARFLASDGTRAFWASQNELWRIDRESGARESLTLGQTLRDLELVDQRLWLAVGNEAIGLDPDGAWPSDGSLPSDARVHDAGRPVTALAAHGDRVLIGMGAHGYRIDRTQRAPTHVALGVPQADKRIRVTDPRRFALVDGTGVRTARYRISVPRPDGNESIFDVGTANAAPFEVERSWSLAWLGADEVGIFAEVELIDGSTVVTPRRTVSTQTVGLPDVGEADPNLWVQLITEGSYTYWPEPIILRAQVVDYQRYEEFYHDLQAVEFYACDDAATWDDRNLEACELLLADDTPDYTMTWVPAEPQLGTTSTRCYGARAITRDGHTNYSTPQCRNHYNAGTPRWAMALGGQLRDGQPVSGQPYTLTARVEGDGVGFRWAGLERNGVPVAQTDFDESNPRFRIETLVHDETAGDDPVTYRLTVIAGGGREFVETLSVTPAANDPVTLALTTHDTPVDGERVRVGFDATDDFDGTRVWAEVVDIDAPACADAAARASSEITIDSSERADVYTFVEYEGLTAAVARTLRICAEDAGGALAFEATSVTVEVNAPPAATHFYFSDHARYVEGGGALGFAPKCELRNPCDEDESSLRMELVDAEGNFENPLHGIELDFTGDTSSDTTWVDIDGGQPAARWTYEIRLTDKYGQSSSVCPRFVQDGWLIGRYTPYYFVPCDDANAEPFELITAPGPWRIELAPANPDASTPVNPEEITAGTRFELQARIVDADGVVVPRAPVYAQRWPSTSRYRLTWPSTGDYARYSFSGNYDAGDFQYRIGEERPDLGVAPASARYVRWLSPALAADYAMHVVEGAPHHVEMVYAFADGVPALESQPYAGREFGLYFEVRDQYDNLLSSTDGALIDLEFADAGFVFAPQAGVVASGSSAQLTIDQGKAHARVSATTVAGEADLNFNFQSPLPARFETSIGFGTTINSSSGTFPVRVYPTELHHYRVEVVKDAAASPPGNPDRLYVGDTAQIFVAVADQYDNVIDAHLDWRMIQRPPGLRTTYEVGSPSGSARIAGLTTGNASLYNGSTTLQLSHGVAESVSVEFSNLVRTSGSSALPIPADFPDYARVDVEFKQAGSIDSAARFVAATGDYRSPLEITFDEPLTFASDWRDFASVQRVGASALPGSWTVVSGTELRFEPSEGIELGARYEIVLAGGLTTQAGVEVVEQRLEIPAPEIGFALQTAREGILLDDELATLQVRAQTEAGTQGLAAFTPSASQLELRLEADLGARFILDGLPVAAAWTGLSDPQAARVETTLADRADWQQWIAEGELAEGDIVSWSLVPTPDLRVANFWQATFLTAAGDVDGDGISNGEEIRTLGSDPFDASDGMRAAEASFVAALDSLRSPVEVRFGEAVVIDPTTQVEVVRLPWAHEDPTSGVTLTGVTEVIDAGSALRWTPDAAIELGRAFEVTLPGEGVVSAADGHAYIARTMTVAGPEMAASTRTTRDEFLLAGELAQLEIRVIRSEDQAGNFLDAAVVERSQSQLSARLEGAPEAALSLAFDDPQWAWVSLAQPGSPLAWGGQLTAESLRYGQTFVDGAALDLRVEATMLQPDGTPRAARMANRLTTRLLQRGGDLDGDGLSNEDEIEEHGTDPGKADSDDDGRNDYDEIFVHDSDPNTFEDGVPVLAVNLGLATDDLRTPIEVRFDTAMQLAAGPGILVSVIDEFEQSEPGTPVAGSLTSTADAAVMRWTPAGALPIGARLRIAVPLGIATSVADSKDNLARTFEITGPEVAVALQTTRSEYLLQGGTDLLALTLERSTSDASGLAVTELLDLPNSTLELALADGSDAQSTSLAAAAFNWRRDPTTGLALGDLLQVTGPLSFTDGASLTARVSAEMFDAAGTTRSVATANLVTRTWLTRTGDLDGDGLTNRDEIEVHGTDPGKADSDSDGRNDYDEIFVHDSDPNTYEDGVPVLAATLGTADGDRRSPIDLRFTEAVRETSGGPALSVLVHGPGEDLNSGPSLTGTVTTTTDAAVLRWTPTTDLPLGQMLTISIPVGFAQATADGRSNLTRDITLIGPELGLDARGETPSHIFQGGEDALILDIIRATGDASGLDPEQLLDLAHSNLRVTELGLGALDIPLADASWIWSRDPVTDEVAGEMRDLSTTWTFSDGATIELTLTASLFDPDGHARTIHTANRITRTWLTRDGDIDGDFDGDGWTNAEELERWGTDPTTPDTELRVRDIEFEYRGHDPRVPVRIQFSDAVDVLDGDGIEVSARPRGNDSAPTRWLPGQLLRDPTDDSVARWLPDQPLPVGHQFVITLAPDTVTRNTESDGNLAASFTLNGPDASFEVSTVAGSGRRASPGLHLDVRVRDANGRVGRHALHARGTELEFSKPGSSRTVRWRLPRLTWKSGATAETASASLPRISSQLQRKLDQLGSDDPASDLHLRLTLVGRSAQPLRVGHIFILDDSSAPDRGLSEDDINGSPRAP